MEEFTVYPIGWVRRNGDAAWIEILPAYARATRGLGDFSHILVLFWFHANDHDDGRAVLEVHPRKDPRNPLTGVFATHSPLRPNLIGLTRCRVLAVTEGRIDIETIDALEGTPVLDIKCFIPAPLAEGELRLPGWVGEPCPP
jgi:tRNA-Thr(GGU) m(6)t(6)A37 methyltransferase TsaA